MSPSSTTDAADHAAAPPPDGLRYFLGSVVAELYKVTWPTRAHTMQAAGVVAMFCLIITILLWVMDKGAVRVFEFLI